MSKDELETRVTELEIQLSYQDQLLNDLNGVVTSLSDELLHAKAVLREVMARLDAALDDGGPVEGEVD